MRPDPIDGADRLKARRKPAKCRRAREGE